VADPVGGRVGAVGLREFLPSASRIGILANVADPFTKPFVGEMQTGAAVLGVEIDPVMVSGAAEFEMGFAALPGGGDKKRPPSGGAFFLSA
jgi:hypothetical protein